MATISASIVLYHTDERQLERLLDCVLKASIIGVIYLIDNSSGQKDSHLFHLPRVVYIKNDSNVGYGAGHNIAIRKVLCSSDYHFVLNPDVYFSPDSLQSMIQRMQADETIGQLMPNVIYPDGSLQYLCKLIPRPSDLLFRRFLPSFLKNQFRKNADLFELRFSGYKCEMNVPILSGCFMLFKISALIKVGLFDERFFMYLEDFDITRRVHEHYRTIYYPKETIIHDHAKESYKFNKMLLVHVVSAIKYFNKWGWFIDQKRVNLNRFALESIKRGG